MKKYKAVLVGMALLVSVGNGFGSEWVIRSDKGAAKWDEGYPIDISTVGPQN